MIDSNRVNTQTRRWRRSSRRAQSTAVCVVCQRVRGAAWEALRRADFSSGSCSVRSFRREGLARDFYTTGMEHSPTSATGTGWERSAWHATQRAAWEALKKASG